MVYVSKISIANANKIEKIHNEWCQKNGYPVRWVVTKGRRRKCKI